MTWCCSAPADRGADLRLPDSNEPTVIAPDLSNLPPGQVAVDPHTGREYTQDQGKDEDEPPTPPAR